MPVNKRNGRKPVGERNGRKPVEELKKHHLNVISSWYRSMSRCPDFRKDPSLVKKYHKSIARHIDKRYSNSGTKRNHYSVLGVVLRYLGEPDLADKYLSKMDVLDKEVKEDTERQGMSKREEESWMNHKDLLKFQKCLEGEYLKDKKDVKRNYNYLIISWYIMRPPTRLEPGNLKIIESEDEIEPKKNYLLKCGKRKYELIIQKDKVSKTYGTLRDKVAPKLSGIISDSLENVPREYFLTQIRDTDKPMGEGALSKHIRRMYGKGLTVGMLRSSYITWIYDKRDDNNTVKELARLMRHSPETARNSYRKYEKGDPVKLIDE